MNPQTLHEIIRRHARERGDRIALRFENEAISYRELEHRACHVANGLLASGVGLSDRIAWLGKNSAAYFECLLGAVAARAVMVPA
jgi:acyl-CoA synthetase (AMP-forming)/AMP-acid ligase II